MIECGQENCEERATFSYIWPGEPKRKSICKFHIEKLVAIANVLGVHLHLQPINEDDET